MPHRHTASGACRRPRGYDGRNVAERNQADPQTLHFRGCRPRRTGKLIFPWVALVYVFSAPKGPRFSM